MSRLKPLVATGFADMSILIKSGVIGSKSGMTIGSSMRKSCLAKFTVFISYFLVEFSQFVLNSSNSFMTDYEEFLWSETSFCSYSIVSACFFSFKLHSTKFAFSVCRLSLS